MRRLGLGFTNPDRTGGVLDVCLCLGWGGVGGVGGELTWGMDQGLEGWCRWGVDRRCGPGSGGMGLYLCEMWVWIICVDDRSRYLCIVLSGYLSSVQSCCTLWISAFWHVFVYSRYRKSIPVYVMFSDLYLSRHQPLLWGAALAIQRVRMTGLHKNGKSGRHCWGREVSRHFHNSLYPLWQIHRL